MAECKECGAAITWLLTASGKRMPVDSETVSRGDTHYEKAAGHQNHWDTCLNARPFRAQPAPKTPRPDPDAMLDDFGRRRPNPSTKEDTP